MELDSEIVEKYRNVCLFYVKLDFGILVAASTMATLLKLDRFEVMTYLSDWRIIIFPVFFLIVYGLFLNNYLLIDWARSKINTTSQRPKLTLREMNFGITVQFFLHILLFGLIMAYTWGGVQGWLSGAEYGKHVGLLRFTIESFNEKNGKVPRDLSELTKQFPEASVMSIINCRIETA